MKDLLWLLGDGLRCFLGRVVRIAIAAGLGTALQLGGIALIFAYGASVEAGKAWTTDSVQVIAGLGAAALGLLLAAARLLFHSRSLTVSLTGQYEELLSARVTESLQRVPDSERSVVSLRAAARHSARIAGRWLTNLPLIARTFTLIAFVLWLHPAFSLLLFAGVLASVFFTFDSPTRVVPGDPDEEPDPSAESPSDGFFDRMRARDRSLLASDLLAAVAIPATFVIGALGAHWQGWTWSAFLAYVAAVRSLLGSLAALRRNLAWTLAQLPYVARLATVVDGRGSLMLEAGSERTRASG